MDGLGATILFLVALSFLLFIMRVGLICYHNILLARELKRLARAAEARQCNNSVVPSSDNQTNQPPKDDLPPAYEDIVHTKLALQAAEEGRMSRNATQTQSTVTLATIVESNENLSTPASAAENSLPNVNSETLPPAYENAVFEHENINNTNLNRAT